MPSENPQLCASCSSIFFLLNFTEPVRRQNVPILVDSCRLCACVWDCRLATRPSVSHSTESYYWLNHARDDTCEFTIRHDIDGKDHCATFHLAPLKDLHQPYISSLTLSPRTFSSSTISFLKSKFKECLRTHSACQLSDPTIKHYKPTRLLNVTRTPNRHVFLQLSDSTTSGPYFTLSHCWGNIQPIKLTRSTEQLLHTGISIAKLPKTFQHAIKVCQHFNVHYLWIDSLCIFQDDRTDWHAEVASMRQVYESAFCNIAATGASNSSLGLSFDRKPNSSMPFEVAAPEKFWLAGEKKAHVEYFVCPQSGYSRNIEYSPLNVRAWVMQERFLSRRIMHFAAEEVYWECRTNMSSDLFPDGLPDWMRLAGEKQRTKLSLLEGKDSSVSSAKQGWTDEQYDAWNMLCEAYTRLNMTISDDKLVALNGIAQKLSLSNNDTLHCGLWSKKLLPQLLWIPRPLIYHPDPYPSTYRSPTWSWASHKRPIVHTAHLACAHGQARVSVESIRVDVWPSGQVKSASLTLRGKIVTATLETNNKNFNRLSTIAHLRCGDRAMRIRGPLLDAYYKDLVPFLGQVVCMAIYADTCHDKAGGGGAENAAFLPLPWELGVLVLKQCQSSQADGDEAEYQRIGILLLDKRDADVFVGLESREECSVVVV